MARAAARPEDKPAETTQGRACGQGCSTVMIACSQNNTGLERPSRPLEKGSFDTHLLTAVERHEQIVLPHFTLSCNSVLDWCPDQSAVLATAAGRAGWGMGWVPVQPAASASMASFLSFLPVDSSEAWAYAPLRAL